MPLPARFVLLRVALCAPLLLAACSASTASLAPSCELAAPTAVPTVAAPGDVVQLYAVALSKDWDTVVTIGSVQATVLGLQRNGCDACDGCLVPTDSADTAYADCNACTYTCDSCAELCATCEEFVRVTVPDLPDGVWPVVLTNLHGSTAAGELTIASPSDTATSAP